MCSVFCDAGVRTLTVVQSKSTAEVACSPWGVPPSPSSPVGEEQWS